MSHPELAGAILNINLGAIAYNYALLCKQAPNSVTASVVKANAYGLGVKYVAPVLFKAGCRIFFVATADEGLELRALLPDAEINILNGVPIGYDALFQDQRLVPVLNSLEAISSWRRFCISKNMLLPAVIHIDTGMARLGLPQNELEIVTSDINLLTGFELRSIMSHLACAENPEHPLNEQQLLLFCSAIKKLPKSKASFASSSGIFLGSKYQFDLIRPGAALYGLCPLKGISNPMAQVVRLQGRILQIRDVDTPQSVGYGATYHVVGPRRIATVAVGYADGVLRSLSNSGSGCLNGIKAPIVGRVSMDLITLDVTDIPSKMVHTGTMIDLIGPDNPLEQIADSAGTIGYELLTSLGLRYHRTYVGTSE